MHIHTGLDDRGAMIPNRVIVSISDVVAYLFISISGTVAYSLVKWHSSLLTC